MSCACADPVTFQGVVLEKGSGDPILGAAVYVVDNDSINTTSDERGRFTLTLPAPGNYTLGAVAVGFERATQIPITGDNAARGPKKIYLRQDFTIPPVVVRAERNAERVSKTVITGEELSQVPGAAGDPLKALQALPGIAMGSDASGAPAIRGSNPEDNAYYIDGVPVGYLFHVGGLVSVLPTNIVDDFNLYAAAFGPEYGDVTGAVIDVALRKPRTDRLGGKVNISLVGADGLIEGPITPHQSVLLSARRSYFDFLLGTIEDKKSGDKITIPRYYDYQGKYIWEVNDANTLTANMNGASDSVGFTTTEKSDNAKHAAYLVGDSSFDVSYHTQDIEWNTRVTSSAVNKMYVGHMRTTQASSIGTAGTIDVTMDNQFVRDEFRFEPTANHAVSVGGDYSDVDVKLNLDILDIPCTRFDPDCDYASGTRKRSVDGFSIRSELLFAKDRWRISPDLTLIGGLHWTHDDYLDRTYIEPRLGAEWEWSPRTLLTAGWGKYNQFPDGGTVIDVFGNPNLQRLRATHSVLGIAQKLDAGWTWKLEGYYKTFDDLVTSDPVVRYTNGASGKAHGAELLVKKDSAALWSGWLSLTYSQSRRKVNATGATLPLDFDQPIIATGVLSYKYSSDWSFGARWTYHTGNPYTPFYVSTTQRPDETYLPNPGEVNSRRLPAYHRLDLRADRHVVYNTWKLNAYLEVINAYNHKNVAGFDYSADYSEYTRTYQLPLVPFIGVEMEF
jgi:outer membrane receptor for ferrienterochelin and colicin